MATKKEDHIQVPGTLTERARPFVPLPPSGVRRGHAHRRSGAISSGDVWSLLSQSAPNLPLGCTGGAGNQSGVDASAQPKGNAGSSPLLSKSAPVSPGFTAPSPLPSPAVPVVESMGEAGDRRSRVHFIDSIEIIPGSPPVESGLPNAPVVAGHSAKDSVSSIATVIKAPVVALPPINTTMEAPATGRRPHGRTRSNSQTLNLPTAALRATSDRPSTAGAILSSPVLKTAPENFPETTPSPQHPAAASHSIDSAQSSPSTPPQKKTHKKALSDYSPLVGKAPFSKHESMSADEQTTDKKKKKKKKGKKQIKNWAGTILGKGKGLRHTTKRESLRAPTPPVPGSENQVPGGSEWVTAAWNENYVLMAVDDSVHPASSTESIVIAETTEGTVIDLDAALKPFTTPAGPAAAGFAAARTRRMHSAVGLKTNGYFHRRSESMPEMTLFSLEEGDDDGHMDDVSEEDESEESESEDEEGKGEGLGIGIKVVDEADGASWQEESEVEWGSEDAGDERSMRRNSEPESEDSWKAHRASLSVSVATVKAVRSNSSMNSSTTDSNVERVSPRKGAPADIITSSSVPTVTGSSPFLCPHPLTNPPDSPLTFVTATSNPNTPVISDFATDEYADSATSFDIYSDFLGEPGPEMRMSVDDVPSLTSSSSTMTMSGIYHNMPATPASGSVGSLPIPPVKEGKEKKEGKSKRWSKVFTFWRK